MCEAGQVGEEVLANEINWKRVELRYEGHNKQSFVGSLQVVTP